MNSEKPLLHIYAPVGEVCRCADGTVRVKLDSRWSHVADGINAAIQAGERLMGDDLVPRIIDRSPSEEQLRTLADVISNRCNGELLVLPGEPQD